MKHEMILANGLGQTGMKTHGFVMYQGIVQAFFNMTAQYVRDTTDEAHFFYPASISKTRKVHRYHITRADILLLMLLQASCYPGTHNLTNVSRRSLYRQFQLLFEPRQGGSARWPISYQQFAIALEKLHVNGIIALTEREGGRFDVQLLHIEAEGRRFVVFHPAFFSARFTSKSVAAMKLAIAVMMQTGGSKQGWFERLLHKEAAAGKSALYGPLFQLLHLTQGAELERVIREWTEEPLFEQQHLLLPDPVYVVRAGRRAVKFTCRLNPFFAIPHTKEERLQQHYIPEPEIRYAREASYLHMFIEEKQIGDFAGKATDAFSVLLQVLRQHGKDVIRHVVYALAEYIREYKRIPEQLAAFADAAVLQRKRAKAADICREAGLQLYVTTGLRPSAAAYHQRWKAFTAKVVSLFPNMTKLRRALFRTARFLRDEKQMLYFLRKQYAPCDVLQYVKFGMDSFIKNLRNHAYVKQVDPVLYRELELEALRLLQTGHNADTISPLLLGQVESIVRPSPVDFHQRPLENLITDMAELL
ncbi:hypothetical protein [Ectobacillus ponti]|uniref:Uncharacterized protein n=1 Tax=Ectobacillus ponti TaxID=2961894 RepID=A0AA42BR85_9BACI|nr:hypothetical protein [Ectobacillus ponti]MCP8970151.1 hypothetical protein [Ectobacillus ponti]